MYRIILIFNKDRICGCHRLKNHLTRKIRIQFINKTGALHLGLSARNRAKGIRRPAGFGLIETMLNTGIRNGITADQLFDIRHTVTVPNS